VESKSIVSINRSVFYIVIASKLLKELK